MSRGGMVQLPVSVSKDKNSNLQDQLTDGIRDLIVSGKLKLNTRLPASRDLSQQLGVSRNTVKTSYLNLTSEGFLQSKGTRGTFVSPTLPDGTFTEAPTKTGPFSPPNIVFPGTRPVPKRHDRGIYDFRKNAMDPVLSPERTLRRLFLHHLPYRLKYSNVENRAGLPLLRQAVADFICPLRGMSVMVDEVVIVGKEMRVLDIVVNFLVSRGDAVALEDPCDARLVFLLQSRGANIIPIAVDGDGPLISSLPRSGAKTMFVSPPHQRPLGVTMSQERKRQLVDWASEVGGHIVEIDTFGEFYYGGTPSPTLFSLDQSGRVIYINAFSEWISDIIGTSYLLIPNTMMDRMLDIKSFFDSSASWLEQRVVADFIISNSLFPHLRRVRQSLAQRRNIAISRLNHLTGAASVSGNPSGCHLLWHLPERFPKSLELQALAASAGVKFSTIYDEYCYLTARKGIFDPNRTIMLRYSAISEEDILLGMKILEKVLSNIGCIKSDADWRPKR